jgi:hypothetical protein
MRFKQFLKTQNNNLEIFESTFEKYYSKGYFGNINKETIKTQQLDWFDKFLLIIEEGDKSMLTSILSSRDHCCTREWFSSIYKVDIRELGKKEILEELNNLFGR